MSGLQLQPKTGVDTNATYVEADEAEWLMNADIVDSLVADWNQDLSHGCYTYKTHGPQPDTDAHWKTSMADIASIVTISVTLMISCMLEVGALAEWADPTLIIRDSLQKIQGAVATEGDW